VIGTAKDAGLLVYDLRGRLIQALRPPNAPRVLPADPATPSGINLEPDQPCADRANDTLYVPFETIGFYRLPLRRLPALVRVGGPAAGADHVLRPGVTRHSR
jgi:hypothetical protein